MKQPGGWLWELRSYRGSHPRTTVKNESDTQEFPSSSVGATPYWGKGQQVKKIHTHTRVCVYILYQ